MADSFNTNKKTLHNTIGQPTYFAKTITTGPTAEIVAHDNINSLKQLFVRWSDDKLNIIPGPAILPGLITDTDEEVNKVFDIGHDTREFRTLYVNTINASGTVNATKFEGDGSALTGIISSYGDEQVKSLLSTYTGNLVSLEGTIKTTGNVIADNIQLSGQIQARGNLRGANLNTVGTVSAVGTITAGDFQTLGNITCSQSVVTSNLSILGKVESDITVAGNINLAEGLNAPVVSVHDLNHHGLSIISANWIIISDEDISIRETLIKPDANGNVEINLSDTVSTNFLVVRQPNCCVKINLPKNPVNGQITSLNIVRNAITATSGEDILDVPFDGTYQPGTGIKYVYFQARTKWYRMV